MDKMPTKDADGKFWREKIGKRAKQSFVTTKAQKQTEPTIGRYAVKMLDALQEHPQAMFDAANLRELAALSGMPVKYVSRSLALLTRAGLVERDPLKPTRVTLHRARLARRKNPSQQVRRPISASERKRLYEADGYRCGHCGEIFSVDSLALDHLVPLSLLGADEPGNWVTLCRRHNTEKLDRFEGTYIRFYRGEPVREPIGVRFKNGFFWPYINGKIRTETREKWKQ